MIAKMELVSVLAPRNRTEEVMRKLVGMGVLHPVDIGVIEKEMANLPAFKQNGSSDFEKIEERFGRLVSELDIPVFPVRQSEKIFCADIEKILSEIEGKVSSLLDEKRRIVVELEKKKALLEKVREYGVLPIKAKSYYTFLELSLGKIREKDLSLLEEKLSGISHILYPVKKEKGEVTALIIALKRDKYSVELALKELGWREVEYSFENISPEFEKMTAEMDNEKEKLRIANERIKLAMKGIEGKLSQIQSFILMKKAVFEAEKFAHSTDKTTVISGWLPAERKDEMVREIKKKFPAYVEIRNPDELDVHPEEIPVKMKNGGFWGIFQPLVISFGIPRYGTIDPTFFIALTFLAMFGIMFADSGHGLILALTGFLLSRHKNWKISGLGLLIGYCGLSSIFFGALFGSFFGVEFRPLWFKPLNNITGIVNLSIVFGVGVITLGIVINVVNAFKDRNYIKAFFDKAGIFSALVYWSGIGFVIKASIPRMGFPYFYLVLALVGLLLLFLKPVVEFVFEKKKTGIANSFMENLIELFEVIMGYLANTVSFIRVAAFSLAHAGLFIAIFELARIAGNFAGGSLSVIILGNIFVIALEGLVVTIQSLRLNYYEFFSKFFVEGRKMYKPLKVAG